MRRFCLCLTLALALGCENPRGIVVEKRIYHRKAYSQVVGVKPLVVVAHGERDEYQIKLRRGNGNEEWHEVPKSRWDAVTVGDVYQ